MPWQQCTIGCDESQTEALSDYLLALGAVSVTLSDAGDQPLFEPPPGATPLWQAVHINALFDDDIDQAVVNLHLMQQFPNLALPRIAWTAIEDKDWERECLDQFKPMRFGQRTWVVPSWETLPQPDAVNILLDPGLAFGTGTHPTTALCLEWLDAQAPLADKLLDVGCGSGILSIAACKLGAKAVYAIDIDPQALQATRDNAIKNNCLDKITRSLPAQLSSTGFHIVVANILANPLIEMAEDLARQVLPQGKIALSGILKDQAQAVMDRYKQWFKLDPITAREDWVRITGIKRDE